MNMKVAKVGVKIKPGYRYYVDENGDISRIYIQNGTIHFVRPELMAKVGIEQKAGMRYFVDDDGDISCSPEPSAKKDETSDELII